MRVALNASSLAGPLTGIGQYTRQLALGLAQEPGLELSLFLGTHWSREPPPAAAPERAHSHVAWLRRFLPFGYELRRLLQARSFRAGTPAGRFDLYHEPNIVALPFEGPTVLTVHDLSWIRYPQAHPPNRVRAMNRHFEPGLRRATLVLTDSEFVRREVVETFGYPAERIRSIPLGVERVFRPMDAGATQPVLARHGLAHGSYFLAVGTLEPRKNLGLVLRAYRALPQALRGRWPLVVIGGKGWNTSALEQELQALARSGEVRQLGYVPREELAPLTAGAATLVYPSIYEGFGLPPLEAMACGVPVIASNRASLPEVVGDAAISIEPDDVEELTRHLRELFESPQLRSGLARRGLERSASFSWERCIGQTLEAYAATAGTAVQGA